MIERIDDVIGDARTIGIAAHIRPDGDAIGSSLGVWNYLEKKYPDRTIQVLLDPIQDKFLFLSGADQIREKSDLHFDLFIALDCGTSDRLGPRREYFEQAKRTLCIDHHVRQGDFADENYIFPDASSTSELVYDLIDPKLIDRKIAECLYMGIAHDTGVFQYSCTSSKTMDIAGKLMDTGIDYSKIVDDTFQSRSYSQNRILGHALDKAVLLNDGTFVASCITEDEMREYGVSHADLDMIVSQLRLTKGIEAACFLYQTSADEYKVSFRSNGSLDVARLCMEYGGGGHVKAAGCSTKLAPDAAISMFAARVAELTSEVRQ